MKTYIWGNWVCLLDSTELVRFDNTSSVFRNGEGVKITRRDLIRFKFIERIIKTKNIIQEITIE